MLQIDKAVFNTKTTEEIPDFKKEFSRKSKVNVVVCTSDSNNTSLSLVLVKVRMPASKHIKEMRFIEELTQKLKIVK